MKYRYRIFRHTRRAATTATNADFELHSGCNGEKHVVWPVIVFYDVETDEVEYEESFPIVELGACDGTCGWEDYGSFLHPCPMVDDTVLVKIDEPFV